MLFEDIM